MLKVLRNLKKSFWSVVVIVILLCIQAATDLALPDYTSKIVNVGIQAGGIETAVPEIISKENMDMILMFSDKDNEVLENYSIIGDTVDNHQEKIINRYLGKDYEVQKDSIYVLNNIEQEKKEELSTILAVPLIQTSTVKSDAMKNITKEQKEELLKQLTYQVNNMSESLRERH